MGIADKSKSSKDNNRVKGKRTRFGNIKDFHGRRQHGENMHVQEETRNTSESSNITPVTCFPQEPVSPCSIFFLPPQQTSKTTIIPKLQLDKTKQTDRTSVSFEVNKFSFDAHMSQWAQDLRKPLITPSTTVEFDMPYCYSEGLYSKVSAESFLKQPFGEPPSELWSPHADSWYEKAQLALQYYRHLCEQPSRLLPASTDNYNQEDHRPAGSGTVRSPRHRDVLRNVPQQWCQNRQPCFRREEQINLVPRS